MNPLDMWNKLGRDGKIAVVVGAIIIGYVYYKHKQNVAAQQAASTDSSGTNTSTSSGTGGDTSGIDPATGIPYSQEGGTTGQYNPSLDPSYGGSSPYGGYGGYGTDGGSGSPQPIIIDSGGNPPTPTGGGAPDKDPNAHHPPNKHHPPKPPDHDKGRRGDKDGKPASHGSRPPRGAHKGGKNHGDRHTKGRRSG